MKNKVLLPIVFFATIAVAITYIVISGKSHVEVIQKSEELVEQKAQLTDSVVSLECAKKESLKKLKEVDSALVSNKKLIEEQKQKIVSLDKETKLLKVAPKAVMASPSIVYIHDTVFITEKKNFWGKTKRTVNSVQSIDSVFNEEKVDTLSQE